MHWECFGAGKYLSVCSGVIGMLVCADEKILDCMLNALMAYQYTEVNCPMHTYMYRLEQITTVKEYVLSKLLHIISHYIML